MAGHVWYIVRVMEYAGDGAGGVADFIVLYKSSK